MTYIKVDVPKPAGQSPGAGLKSKSIITLIDVEDIVSMPERDSKGVLLVGAFALKTNAYAIKVYATQDTISVSSPSEGDSDNEGFVPELKFTHPGNKLEIREFKANMIGRNLIAIIESCDGRPKDVFGSICEPMKLSVSFSGDKDKTSNEFTLKQAIKGNDIAMFEGNVPYAMPVAVVPAGAISILLAGEGEYQLTGGALGVKITEATGATNGMFFTLLGAPSETAPSIESSSVFVLKDGADWIGSPGRQITFQAMKTGPNTYSYIEKSRV